MRPRSALAGVRGGEPPAIPLEEKRAKAEWAGCPHPPIPRRGMPGGAPVIYELYLISI